MCAIDICNKCWGWIAWILLFTLEGIALLLLFLLHEGLLFIVILSICIGIAAMLSFFHEICWFRPLAPDIQALMTLIILTMLGEAVTLLLKGTYFHRFYARCRIKFPCMFQFIPSFIWYSSVILTYALLYIEYQNAHPCTYFGNRKTDQGFDTETLNTLSTLLVLLALSFLTYTVPRGSDWMKYRWSLTSEARRVQMGSCTIYFTFWWIQVILLATYSIPLGFLVYLCRQTETAPLLTFTVLMFTGVIIGLNTSEFEKHRPFPTQLMSPPHYAFENHLAVRVNLFQYCLIPLCALSYYGTGQIGSLGPKDQFLAYSLLLSMTILQTSKFTCNEKYLRALRNIRIQRQRDLVQRRDEQVVAEQGEIEMEGNQINTEQNQVQDPTREDCKECLKNNNENEENAHEQNENEQNANKEEAVEIETMSQKTQNVSMNIVEEIRVNEAHAELHY